MDREDFLASYWDNHSHIIYDPIQKMVRAASAKGMSGISVTEHISQIEDVRQSVHFGSTHKSGKIFRNLAAYREQFGSVDACLDSGGSIQVKKGLEVDFIQSYEKEISAFVSSFKWDIILRSVHELASGKDIEEKQPVGDAEKSTERWKNYIQAQTQLVRYSEIRFNVLTHPVRLAVGTPFVPKHLVELLTSLSDACKNEGTAMEINGKDLINHPKLVRELAKACSASNCPVSFGSDAHHPNEVGRGHPEALRIADEFGLKLISS